MKIVSNFSCVRVLLILLSGFVLSWSAIQAQPVASRMYDLKTLDYKTDKNLRSATLFKGSVYNMEMMQMTYNTLLSVDTRAFRVPHDEERILLVKDGTLKISMNDSTWLIEGGSVALLMPDQRYELGNAMSDTCSFYLLSYHAKLVDRSRGTSAGGSTVKDWNKIVFHPHDKGGIRRYFDRPTAMCKRLEMHVTTLNKGFKSHDPHTHVAEEIVLVISGDTEMQIGDKFYKGGPGVVYFLGSNVPHAIRNDGGSPSTYFAFQF
ncbi:cupin domain-containing protein [Chryseolinea sp. T2]|uniref:cupin domain-containing protein n=1 Tax=Chryseolinea sp. T2 TaxID=3129255 RepID=UPI003077CD1C